MTTRVTIAAMCNGDEKLPVEVEAEAGTLISELHTAGWTVAAARYDAKSFGNWYVELRRAASVIRLVKDRSQYFVAGPSTPAIKAAGLWRAFDNVEEFRQTVVNWARNADV